jgi:hypothetical protein
MAKTNINQIFEDLDTLRNFCVEYGYRFDERDLYNNKSNTYKVFQRHMSGKPVKNNWEADLAKFKEQEVLGTHR